MFIRYVIIPCDSIMQLVISMFTQRDETQWEIIFSDEKICQWAITWTCFHNNNNNNSSSNNNNNNDKKKKKKKNKSKNKKNDYGDKQ